jgi:hypothetical protein
MRIIKLYINALIPFPDHRFPVLPVADTSLRPLREMEEFSEKEQLKTGLVPGTGLEPAHLAAKASKTFVSAIPPPGRNQPFTFEAKRAGASAD